MTSMKQKKIRFIALIKRKMDSLKVNQIIKDLI